ncbi:MAG: hypothetical protein HC800_06365 [Phormidesmis sp. RL_2_1]|nr:hypothetical protein [Phormidesmis sp. RL_2_1]
MPAAQPKLNLSTEAAEPLAEPLTSGSTSDSTFNSTSAPTSAPAQQRSPDQQAPSATERSPSKPFNPYDMKALKQFDQGSHRQQ